MLLTRMAVRLLFSLNTIDKQKVYYIAIRDAYKILCVFRALLAKGDEYRTKMMLMKYVIRRIASVTLIG